jgi:hypothetical protein
MPPILRSPRPDGNGLLRYQRLILATPLLCVALAGCGNEPGAVTESWHDFRVGVGEPGTTRWVELAGLVPDSKGAAPPREVQVPR